MSGTIDQDDIDLMLSRIKVVSNAEAERLRRPEFEDPAGPALRKLLKDAGLPERHLALTEPDTSGGWGKVFSWLASKRGTGFLCALIGPRGLGKTQMAAHLSRDVIKAGGRARFASATRFFMEIKETYRKETQKTERQVVQEFAQPKFLTIDEIGRRGETDWEDRLLFELLNDRYNAMNDTIVLSNHPTVAEFSKAVGDSLVSRINETGGVIVCDWKSYRTH